MKLRKEDYESQEAKELKQAYQKQLAEDKERELAKNAISRIPEQRREWVLRLLSEMYATKGTSRDLSGLVIPKVDAN